MRTISAKYPKGQELPRLFFDEVKLLWYILSTGLSYLVVGHNIRRKFYRKQRAREKYYLDEPELR